VRRASLACAAAIALATAWPSAARANGRFPESNQITFAAHDPDLVLLRVTFGLLVSHDRGATFHWVCEKSIGFSGVEDPMYAVTPSNGYVGTTFQGLTISRDRACSWAFAGGELDNQLFIDLAADPADPRHIVTFSSTYDSQDDAGNVRFRSRLWETRDEAHTFQPLGYDLDPTLLGHTVDLTRTDPDRIYITAVRDPGVAPKGVLLTSKDRGANFEELAVPLLDTERAVFIAAVDPNDAERVYLRTSNSQTDRPGRLLLREPGVQGGPATVRTLFTSAGALLGFALSPDGSRVYVGGPFDGVQVASTSDFVFAKRSSVEVQCLALSPDGLWACSNEASGFVAGLSKDDGATFEPRLHFCDIQGPLGCAPGSPTHDHCTAEWPRQRTSLGCAADAGRDAGGAPVAPAKDGGCSFRAGATGPWGAGGAALGAAVLALRLAAARRRRR
jgi:hypothetical protein